MRSLDIPPLPVKASRGVKRHPVQEPDDLPVPGPSTTTKRARTGPTVLSTPSNSSARPRKGRRQELAPLAFPPSLYEGFFSQLANTSK